MVRRYDFVLIKLDPTVGAEAQKIRSSAVISLDDMGRALKTVSIAPMTPTHRGWKFSPLVTDPKNQRELALDQLRAADKSRIIKPLGALSLTAKQQLFV